MKKNEALKNLDGLAIISIDMDIWSGQTKLEDTDLYLSQEYNRDVVNIGNKRLVGRDALKPFDRIKSAVRRQLLRRGIQFLSGYAVPVEQLDEVVTEVEGLKSQFDGAVTDFLATYHGNVESWISQNPADEDVIRRGTLPLAAVEKRFQFVWDAFHVQSVGHETAQTRLETTAGQLGDKLVSGIQETARNFWDKNLRGRSMIGITCQATLREMKRKLESLSFLDARTKPLIVLLDKVISQSERPESRAGRNFIDPFFSQLVASVLILADNNRMNEYLDGYEEGLASGEIQSMISAPAQPALFEPEETKPEANTPAQAVKDTNTFFDALAEIAGVEATTQQNVESAPAPAQEAAEAFVDQGELMVPVVEAQPTEAAEKPASTVAAKPEPQEAQPVSPIELTAEAFGFGNVSGGW